ncbi:NUDIX hydrolase [Streptomyces sp. NPDC005151]
MTHQNPTRPTEAPDTPGEPARPWMPRQEWVKPQALIASCVVLLDQQGRMLMLRYADSEPSGGTWWLPGGMLDHGEDPLTAARREMYEETGVTVSPAPRLIGYDHRVDGRQFRIPQSTGRHGTFLVRVIGGRVDAAVEPQHTC